MKRAAILMMGLLAVGCGGDDIWFDGDLAAAKQAAQEADTLIMMDFFTEW